jgi:hypothetical protein
MGRTSDAPGTSHSIDVTDVFDLPDVRALLEQRARFLDSLSPEARAKEDARAAAEDEAARGLCEEDERAYAEATREADHAVDEQHRQIANDRAAGKLGTLTEIGRPFGLSAVKTGRILDEHGLRERVAVHDHWDPHSDAMSKIEAEKRKRWAEFRATFRPDDVSPPVTPARSAPSPLQLLRAIPEGFAVHDRFDGRDYWIVAKVAPLLAAHGKRTP